MNNVNTQKKNSRSEMRITTIAGQISSSLMQTIKLMKLLFSPYFLEFIPNASMAKGQTFN